MNFYFSYPERSQERTKITEDVAQKLHRISNHWNNRTVRLWFNNNKNSNFCQTTKNSLIANNITNHEPLESPPTPQAQKDDKIPPLSELSNSSDITNQQFPKSLIPLPQFLKSQDPNSR